MATYASATAGSGDTPSQENAVPIIVRQIDRSKSVVYRQKKIVEGVRLKAVDILKVLVGLKVNLQEIKACSASENGSFTITFASMESKNLAPGVIKLGECELTKENMEDFNVRRFAKFRFVRVFGIPTEVEDGEVGNAMNKFGRVISVRRQMLRDFPSIENGIRLIQMNADMKPVPWKVWILGHTFRTSYTGQADHIKEHTICFNCREKGHFKNECRVVKEGWENMRPETWNEEMWKVKKMSDQLEKENVLNREENSVEKGKETEGQVQKGNESGSEDVGSSVSEEDGSLSVSDSESEKETIEIESSVWDKIVKAVDNSEVKDDDNNGSSVEGVWKVVTGKRKMRTLSGSSSSSNETPILKQRVKECVDIPEERC